MIDIHEIADNADMIVNGYAFTKCDGNIRVLNLNNVESAAVINAKEGGYRNDYGRNRERFYIEKTLDGANALIIVNCK